MFLLIIIFLNWIFNAFLLSMAVKITRNECTLSGMMAVTGISTLMQSVPLFGWLLGPIFYLVLLTKFSTAVFWPDAILISIVNGLLSIFIRFILCLMLAALLM